MYIPELVLGHLMTGSNFGETQTTGGQHGFGAKLTNIFSSMFRVETCDMSQRKLYHQEWRNNMMDRTDPVITDIGAIGGDAAKHADFTRVSFTPDLTRKSNAHASEPLPSTFPLLYHTTACELLLIDTSRMQLGRFPEAVRRFAHQPHCIAFSLQGSARADRLTA